MKLLKYIIFVSLILSSTINITAQEQRDVTYKPRILYAVDSFQAFGACMILTNETDTIGKIADTIGYCTFDNIKPGKYYREISTITYFTIRDTIEIGYNNKVYSDTTYLKKNNIFSFGTVGPPKRPNPLILEKMMKITITYSGYIFSQKDSLPIQYSVLKVFGTNIGVTSNSDGHFIVDDIQTGKYNFSVESFGFETVSDLLVIDSTNVIDTFYLKEITP